jgi:hypothetical protein
VWPWGEGKEGRWEREAKKEERWKMEAKTRGEYWNDGLMRKSCTRGVFNIPLFHYPNIPHRG